MHIISKCHDCIQTAMDSIDPQKDTSIVIEKHKSGDVPPGDFKFEDMQDPRSMLRDDHLASTGMCFFCLLFWIFRVCTYYFIATFSFSKQVILIETLNLSKKRFKKITSREVLFKVNIY